ncbi:MAG TPA: ABC transporter ATP-binding protein [Nitrospirae bacterium]|nr:ABC transporter ATP-binding protein [Nitrospirota bacterium]HDL20069.1 ABC transporter ATP-binding protein [Nitrospirota bacterium]HDZ00294.1 ABC transporter ATP-binding protein [Nitrospirota bacterium]
MHQSLLSVEDLSISFTTDDKPVKTVDGVSFPVEREDFHVLVGESGSGKTLTALSIMRLLPSNAFFSGKILFNGEDMLTKQSTDLRKIRGRDISMVFQEPMTSLNPVFNIGYQIAEAFLTHRNISKKEAMDRAIELLRSVKIPSPGLRIKEYPHQMSGGMRQRVMIAMAIACNPSLIIADEPTTALDVTIQAQILELLGGLKERNKMSLLFITHDLGIVAERGDSVEVMYAGRIVEKANVNEIFLHPGHPYTIGLLESLPKGKGAKLIPIPGQVPKLNELPPGCKFAPRCRYVIKECREKEPELVSINRGEHLSRCIRAKEL